ncbi:adenylate/guanylate cyclase domain-containing protein [Bacterioplanes sanyensis]|uniref:Adenylate/guanylate cyclase domain-containing protein n=2 Tax=Bacterioplanes sanyensis TaxID=1249553 RepID=A0A222FPP6_9GAMM|nr:adenylate/guanylate cyclase domain-containing protein [Bacterioplanes sanyensis]
MVLVFVLALFSHSSGQSQHWLSRLDYLLFDVRFQWLGAPVVAASSDHRIVIVDVDEASLAEVGRWPWSRARLAQLVDRLADAGAAVVAFDVVFSEAEANPLDQAAERAQQINIPFVLPTWRAEIDADLTFARSIGAMDTVLGFFFLDQSVQHGVLPRPLQQWSVEQSQNTIHISKPGFAANIEVLQNSAQHAGFVTTFVDGDGVVRRSPMLIAHQHALYPSLSLATVMTYLLVDDVGIASVPVGELSALHHLHLLDQHIRTDAAGRVIVPFRGKKGSYVYVSAAQLLAGQVDSEILEGAIVLVGTSAQGLADLRTTPLQTQYPGVEVHANLIDGLLQGQFPYRPDWEAGALWVQTVLVGLLLSFLLPRLSPVLTVALCVACVLCVVALNYYWWATHGLDIRLAILLLLIFLLMLMSLADGFRREYLSRRRLRGMFDQYVPPAHIEHMMADPQQYQFDGESRTLTVLFSDIRNFTRISEQLSASELKQLLNRYFTPITRLIFDHDGTIDKYVGDMVVAFWGAPIADERHAHNAVAAALAILSVTETLSRRYEQQGLPAIRVGIGLNTGIMNVGDMGSAYRRSYTVLGDAVNLGSRLESITKYYQVPILVSEYTRQQAPEFVYQLVDCIQVKGKEQAVRVYRPLCHRTQLNDNIEEQLAKQQHAYGLYLARQWNAAEQAFSVLADLYPTCRFYNLYVQRCREFISQPPEEGWNGVYHHSSK